MVPYSIAARLRIDAVTRDLAVSLESFARQEALHHAGYPRGCHASKIAKATRAMEFCRGAKNTRPRAWAYPRPRWSRALPAYRGTTRSIIPSYRQDAALLGGLRAAPRR